MEMVGHDDKFVEQVCALFTAGKYALNEDFCNLRHTKKLAPLPCRGGNEIRLSGAGPVRWLAHRSFRG